MLAFNFTAVGASHIKKGVVCQDFSLSGQTDNYSFAAVSDGHGGEDYFRSDRGSRFAAEAFCECLQEAFENGLSQALTDHRTERQLDKQLDWFMQSIVARWNFKVDENITAEPFTEAELEGVSDRARARYEKGEKQQSAYGATLIGIVVTKSFWFGVHIGDGNCIAFDREGSPSEPIPWDEQCFLNVTTSICDSNALAEFRHFFSREIPAAVIIGSDGIDDCFAGSEPLYNFYRVILTSFVTESEDKALADLESYLPELSEKGSGDDMSVAAVVDTAHIRRAPELYETVKKPELTEDIEAEENTVTEFDTASFGIVKDPNPYEPVETAGFIKDGRIEGFGWSVIDRFAPDHIQLYMAGLVPEYTLEALLGVVHYEEDYPGMTEKVTKRIDGLPEEILTEQDGQGRIVFCGTHRNGIRHGLGSEFVYEPEFREIQGLWQNGELTHLRDGSRLVPVTSGQTDISDEDKDFFSEEKITEVTGRFVKKRHWGRILSKREVLAVYIYAEGGTAKEIKKECDELFDFQELWDEAAQRYTMQPADSWLRPLPEETLTELDREAAEWGFNYRYSQRDGTDD